MTITTEQMFGAIEKFWGAVYAKDISAVSALISTDLNATYQVTINGAQQPEKKLNFNEYIAEMQQLFSSFSLASSEQRQYDPGTFKLTNGTATWSVNYLQTLQLTNGAGVMNSTGTQTWTFNGAQFVALAVIEYDNINIPGKAVKCTLV